MNKAAKKLVCTALAGALGISGLTGCSKEIDGTADLITCGEDTVSVGTENLMLRMNQAQMLSYYAMMGGSTTGVWDQDAGDDQTYGEVTKDNVITQLENMILLKQHAADYDVSVSEEEQTKIEEAAKNFMEANDETTVARLAVTQEDVEDLLTLYTYQSKMYDPMIADVDTEVSDEEAAQSKISYCRIDISDTQNEDGTTTPLTDEEKQAKKDQAQTILDKLNASEDPASADLNEIAKEVDENLNGVENTFDDEDTILDDKLKEAAKTLSDGEVYQSVVEGENAYFVVRMDSVLDREATDAEKENIVVQRQQEAYTDLLDQWTEEADFTVNEKEWDKAELNDYDQYTIKQPETEETAEEGTEENDTSADTEENSETTEETTGDADTSETTDGADSAAADTAE